ncbi:four helix bundle protein [Pendulispora rubella]|uniref:four helix bundle protein n=1 Tax=Pendulispora rubella TaxID=2741070 RepID=UPI00374DFDAE
MGRHLSWSTSPHGGAVGRFCLPAGRERSTPAPRHSLAFEKRGRCHASFAGKGMQSKPPHHPSSFQVLELTIQAIESLGPIVTRIRHHDRDLGEQLRRALSSVALNVAEGNRSQGGHRIARFSTAAGSNSESRVALRVAVAWGYVQKREIEAGERLLDRVAAMLHRLGVQR